MPQKNNLTNQFKLILLFFLLFAFSITKPDQVFSQAANCIVNGVSSSEYLCDITLMYENNWHYLGTLINTTVNIGHGICLDPPGCNNFIGPDVVFYGDGSYGYPGRSLISTHAWDEPKSYRVSFEAEIEGKHITYSREIWVAEAQEAGGSIGLDKNNQTTTIQASGPICGVVGNSWVQSVRNASINFYFSPFGEAHRANTYIGKPGGGNVWPGLITNLQAPSSEWVFRNPGADPISFNFMSYNTTTSFNLRFAPVEIYDENWDANWTVNNISIFLNCPNASGSNPFLPTPTPTPSPTPVPILPCDVVYGYVRQDNPTQSGVYGAQVRGQRITNANENCTGDRHNCTTSTTNLNGYWEVSCYGQKDCLYIIKEANPVGCESTGVVTYDTNDFDCTQLGTDDTTCRRFPNSTTCGPLTFWVSCDSYVHPTPTPSPTPTPEPCPLCASRTPGSYDRYFTLDHEYYDTSINNPDASDFVFFTPNMYGEIERIDTYLNNAAGISDYVSCRVLTSDGNIIQGPPEVTSQEIPRLTIGWQTINLNETNRYYVNQDEQYRLQCRSNNTTSRNLRWHSDNNNALKYYRIYCCPVTIPLSTSWFQVIGGNILALGDGITQASGVKSPIPYDDSDGPCIEANNCKPALISSLPYTYAESALDSPGFVLSKAGNITTHQNSPTQTSLIHIDAERSQSADGHAIDDSLKIKEQGYYYFLKKFAEADITNFTGSNMPSLSTDSFNVRRYQGDLTITQANSWQLGSNQQAIIFVDGNLIIDGNSDEQIITVDEGGFLMFVVKGDITIKADVGYTIEASEGNYLPSTTPANIEGVFIADGVLTTEGYTDTTPDKKLIAAGTYVGWSGVNLERSFLDTINNQAKNSYNPAETFVFRPDLLLNMPQELKSFHRIWKEVAPRRLDS